MLQVLFKTAASVVSLYSTLCFIRIIITWFPRINYSSFGRILSNLCDPYLDLFTKLPLRVGMLDLTPILSLGILTVVSSILNNIAFSGVICFSDILSFVVSMLWSIFSSFATILLVVLVVRYIVSIFFKSSNNYDSPWQMVDNAIRGLVFNICKPFTHNRPISYQSALIIDAIIVFFLVVVVRILMTFLIRAIQFIPF